MQTRPPCTGWPGGGRGPRRRRHRLRRGPVRPRAAHRARPVPRRGGRRRPRGLRDGSADGRITVRALLTAMRTAARSQEIAELAVRHRDEGVVGFDIAGAEAGWPPSRHLDAFQYVHRENFHVTIHAGEGYGLPSIWEAVQYCGAERLGHGVRLAEDIRWQGRPGHPRPAGQLHQGPPHPVGDVPHLQRADRCRRVHRDPPAPAAAGTPVPGHRQHRQPADVPGHPDRRVRPAGQASSATTGPTCSGSPSTR